VIERAVVLVAASLCHSLVQQTFIELLLKRLLTKRPRTGIQGQMEILKLIRRQSKAFSKNNQSSAATGQRNI
jgi:hypothetical protein